MTDKERLEEMKGIISTWKTILSEGNFADVTSEEVKLVEYVIQQAERVEELEESEREWVLFQAQVNCINQKLQQLNKRYREAMEKAKYESSHRIGDSGMIKIYEILSEALEGDCIHCNGKGFNGLDYCPQCNQMGVDDDN